MAAELQKGRVAVTTAVRSASAALKAELRSQVVSSGLGARLSKTWQDRVYPEKRPSLNAAGLVYSKAPKLIGVFDRGATIKAKNGFWLAIPLPAAGKYGDGRQRITPGDFERRTGLKLRFVYRRGRPALLVAEGARVNSKGRAVARRYKDRTSGFDYTPLKNRVVIPVFILVPQVTLRKRLDIAGAARRWETELPALVVATWTGLDRAG